MNEVLGCNREYGYGSGPFLALHKYCIRYNLCLYLYLLLKREEREGGYPHFMFTVLMSS